MRPCLKVSYPTPTAAALALLALRRNVGRDEVAIHPCAQCHAFHLTSDRASASNRWTALGMRKVSANRRSA
jgi:hypothetical protein